MTVEYSREFPSGARLFFFRHQSRLLQGNPLGDPAERVHPVLVPPQGAAGLPLAVVLLGFTGFGQRVINRSLWSENLPERIVRLLGQGKLPPAVFFWPSCETRLGGSQYRNSSATGPYQDYLIQELLPELERRLGCGGAGRRVVAGKSSGGYGALHLSMQCPGTFAAAASHAGDMAFEFCYQREFPAALNAWRRHGGPWRFLQALESNASSLDGDEHAAADVLAMAACYSPNPAAPCGYDLPVDPENGEPRPEVFQRWLECDPLRLVERPTCAAALRELKLLYLDAGERDQFALQWGLRRFCRRLQDAGVPHRAEFFDGGHFDIDQRYEVSLPLLLARISP